MRFTVRQIVVSGMLGAVAIFLGASGLGFIPVPTPAQHATIMHIPVIVGAITEGPLVGTMIGLIFGIYSLLNATSPFFADPLVAVIPRLFIGVVAYGVFRVCGSGKLGIALAAVAGTLTNTVLVLGMIVLRGYLPGSVALAVGVTNGIPEIVVAVLILLAVYPAIIRIPGTQLASRRKLDAQEDPGF